MILFKYKVIAVKKIIFLIISILILSATIIFLNPVSTFLAEAISKGPELVMHPLNAYTKKKDYLYVQRSNTFIPYSYQDLLNIIYTTIDNGWDTFTFYCPKEYEKCLSDMEKISKDELIYTHINNYVHPFNSFSSIDTVISDSGEITLNVKFLYPEEDKLKIDAEADRILKEIIKDDMDVYDQIKTVHDYIVEHTRYDIERNEKDTSPYKSNTAYGAIFDGYATCVGYTDLLAIYLTKLGIDNYKIATTPDAISYSKTGHIWNAVYYNNEWVHIDLTWDDPVSYDANKNLVDYLFHTYFLVNNEAMHEADIGETVLEEHNFDANFYLEFK